MGVNVLDPTTPWPWLLYALAGAAIVTAVGPSVLNQLDAAERDAFNAHPPLKAFIWLFAWAVWPLLAASLLLAACQDGFWVIVGWVGDRIRRREK